MHVDSITRYISYPFLWRQRRGWWVLISATFAAILIILLCQLLEHSSPWAAALFAYRKRYVAAIILLVVVILVLTYLMHTGSRRLNRVLGIVCVIAFIAAEVGIRRVESRHPFQMPYRVLSPYVMFSGKPGMRCENPTLSLNMSYSALQGTIDLNELGYRGPAPDKEKGDEYRILVLGGSTIFNGSPASQTIPAHLEHLFHESGQQRVRVYNWGLISAVSGQELATLVFRAMDYKPDLVVVYNGANDVISPFYFDPRPGYPYNFMLTESGQRLAERGTTIVDVLAGQLQRSRALEFAFGNALSTRLIDIKHVREQCGYGTAAWEQRIADTYAKYVERMAVFVRAHKADVVVCLQPLLFHRAQRVGHEKDLPAWTSLSRHVHRAYPKMSDGAAARIAAIGDDRARFVDLSSALAAVDEALFWDQCHVNNRGNSIIANQIFSEIHPIVARASRQAGVNMAATQP